MGVIFYSDKQMDFLQPRGSTGY